MASDYLPMLDLTSEQEFVGPTIAQAIRDVIASGQYINGQQVRQFEAEVADYLGVRYAVGLNSGTDALVLGLHAMGIGPGDEVITTPFSFVASAEAIRRVGAEPVFADINAETFQLDPSTIEPLINTRTRAIIPVHLFGLAAGLPAILELADRYGLAILEDTAQAFGAEVSKKKAGTLATAGAYSFFPSKPLGSYGDGGLFVTNDQELATRVRQLSRHGAKVKYHNEQVGYNSRLDEIQAAILRVKLQHVEAWNATRRSIAQQYSTRLASHRLVTQTPRIFGPEHVFHQYTIRVSEQHRGQIQTRLTQQGISSMVYYPKLISDMPAYESCPVFANLEVAAEASRTVLSLPISPFLSEHQIARVCDGIAIA